MATLRLRSQWTLLMKILVTVVLALEAITPAQVIITADVEADFLVYFQHPLLLQIRCLCLEVAAALVQVLVIMVAKAASLVARTVSPPVLISAAEELNSLAVLVQEGPLRARLDPRCKVVTAATTSTQEDSAAVAAAAVIMAAAQVARIVTVAWAAAVVDLDI